MKVKNLKHSSKGFFFIIDMKFNPTKNEIQKPHTAKVSLNLSITIIYSATNSKERGEAIARENGIRFLETSAKTNVNIDRAFIELSESILDKTVDVQEVRQPLPPANQSSNRSQCCTN